MWREKFKLSIFRYFFQVYIVYYNFVTKTLLTEIFPYVCLVFFNACICSEIRWEDNSFLGIFS